MYELPKRTFWIVDIYASKDYDGDYRREQVNETAGYLISSLCENGRHAPALDFDFPVSIREEPYGFDNQLDFFRPVPIDKLYGLYEVFAAGGFISPRDPDSIGRQSFPLSDFHHKKPYHFCPVLIAPFRLLPSSTAGHFHLYIDRETEWPQYAELLQRLTGAGLIEENYYRPCVRRKQSFLLKPGVTKDDIRAMQARKKAPVHYFEY